MTAPHDDEQLKLSPSETMAHNSAMRISGARRGERSTQKALASIVLGFELFIVFLIGLTVYGLSLLEPRVWGIYGGLILCGVIIVALGLMRLGKVGIWIGWAVQALTIASGLLLPAAAVVGVIFAALWVYCMIKGARIDRDRRAWMAGQGEP